MIGSENNGRLLDLLKIILTAKKRTENKSFLVPYLPYSVIKQLKNSTFSKCTIMDTTSTTTLLLRTATSTTTTATTTAATTTTTTTKTTTTRRPR